MALVSTIVKKGYPIIVSDRAISNPGIQTSVFSPMTDEQVVCPTSLLIAWGNKWITEYDINHWEISEGWRRIC